MQEENGTSQNQQPPEYNSTTQPSPDSEIKKYKLSSGILFGFAIFIPIITYLVASVVNPSGYMSYHIGFLLVLLYALPIAFIEETLHISLPDYGGVVIWLIILALLIGLIYCWIRTRNTQDVVVFVLIPSLVLLALSVVISAAFIYPAVSTAPEDEFTG